MATTDLERLVVQFSADFKRLENETKRSTAMFSRQLRQMERNASASVKRINTAFSGIGRVGGLAKGLLAGVSVATAKNFIDSAIRIENALKVAGLSGKELEAVYQDLFKIATKNAVPLETLVTLYGRLSLVQKELGASQQDLKTFTDSIAMALRVAGTNPEAASGALLQLSQALGSSVVRAEEFNSLMEGGLPILQAAAAGIKEAGGSVNTLRQLMLNGELSSKAFFRGIEAGTPILEDRLSGAVLTIDQRLTNLKTSLVDAAKRFNTSSQAANTFGAAIDNVANFVNDINFDALIGEIQRLMTAFAQGQNYATNFAKDVGDALGLDSVGKFLTGGDAQKSFLGGALTITSSKVIQDRITDAFKGGAVQGSAEIDKILRDKYGKGARVASTTQPPKTSNFTPISLADFAVPGSEKTGRAGGGRSSGRERINEYERELRSINERTAATVAETEALRQLNPLVDDYGYAVEKARTEQDLMNAAQRAGLAITPELRAQIAATADQWAMATAEANKLAEAQDKIRQRSEEWQDAQKDALRGIVDDLIQGKSAAEAFAGALQKIANKLLDMAFDDLFTGLFKGSGGGGGFLSGLIPGFAKGTNSAPRGLAVVGENGPELVRFRGGEQVIPNHKLTAPTMPNLRGASSSSGGGSFTFAPVIDARGADVAAVARLEQVVAKQQAEFSGRVVQTMRQAKSTRNWRG